MTWTHRHMTEWSSRIGRAAKARVLLCLLTVGLGIGLGWNPPVPDTILLPDSLGPLLPGYHLASGSSTDNIYVASESADIIVVDGNTFQRIKRIYTGTPVGDAFLVSQHNKLYCSYPMQGHIGIIDCATDSIIRTIQVGTRPTLLCYSSGSDKLYCGDTIDCTVSVIDCATNTPLGVISVGEGLVAMTYDPTTDKVYAGTKDALRAISCSSDSIVASISSLKWARSFCVNKRRQKLYTVAGYYRLNPDTIYVVSTQSDSVIGALPPCYSESLQRLACNETTDRLYAVATTGYAMVYEFDCAADTLIRFNDVGYNLGPLGLACDTVHNRLFYQLLENWYVSIYVVDCATLEVISDYAVEPRPGVLELDPARYRVMCTGWSDGYGVGAVLEVFDYKHDTTYACGAVPLSGWGHEMCHNPVTSRLYCHLGYEVTAVVDEQTNRIVKWAQGVGGDMAYSRTSNKFYFPVTYGPSSEYQGLGVVDGSTDSVIKIVGLGGWDPLPRWCPEGNKVYCFAEKGARWFMAAVDCNSDSVVWERDMYDHGRWFEYLDNGLMLVNYTDSLALIDPRADSVLAESSLAAGAVCAVTHTGDGEKIYLVRHDPGRLEVRSSNSLKLLSTIDWPYLGYLEGASLAYSDTARKLYWFVHDSVLAIDAAIDTVTARIATSALFGGTCLDHTGEYLFCASYRALSVYDMRSDSLVAVYPQAQVPLLSITPSPEQHRIYVGCPDVILVYPDAPPGVEETSNVGVRAANCGPTVARDILYLPEVTGRKPQATALLDVTGRKVMDLQVGPNDVRALAPGVYFVREEPEASSPKPQAARKVVVTR